MAASANGEVYALWLDHRDTAQVMSGHAHHYGADASAKSDGVARAQRSQLFVGSLDGRLAARGIARGVCYCCKTALTADADGTIYAAWRHVYPGNMRDIAFTMSRDGGRSFEEPARVSEDEWQLDGWPENGPALAVDASKRIHVLWPTLVKDGEAETLKLFHAFSADGRRFVPCLSGTRCSGRIRRWPQQGPMPWSRGRNAASATRSSASRASRSEGVLRRRW